LTRGTIGVSIALGLRLLAFGFAPRLISLPTCRAGRLIFALGRILHYIYWSFLQRH